MSSTHTTPKNEWVIAMPNISGIDPKRLTRERLLFELKNEISMLSTPLKETDISENQENQNII
ncbi:16162_t:CDS:2, partial [Funneliformis caledonium]